MNTDIFSQNSSHDHDFMKIQDFQKKGFHNGLFKLNI